MQDICAPFAGKKITVMGLGLLGRGVGDAEFIVTCGAKVLVTDKKTEEQLKESVERLKRYPNITFHLGGHRIEDFTNCDMVIKAAGVPLDSPEIAAAKKAGVPVYMSTALFAKYAAEAGATIVGVTGTRGKTTVTSMIHHSLISAFAKASADKRAHHDVFLGGNVRGLSTLAMLPEIQKGDICVLELDSWQLQGFGDLQISPHIAVFTNLFQDHMNYYRDDMEKYFADKANIFKFQKSGDTFIVGNGLKARLKAVPTVPSGPLFPPALLTGWTLKVPGEHNRENAALAAAALRVLGLSDDEIRIGLESFEPVEGRLQFVREVRGVKIYNDNNATTPEATIAALHALSGLTKSRQIGEVGLRKSNIVLIMGGDDKKLDMSKLVEEIPKRCSKVVLFKERGTDCIRDEIFALQPAVEVYEEEGLKATVERAFAVAKPGETILYSPAFSSFGQYFKNEFDRGDQFMSLVKDL
ncbi:UDP-N-acetylmuramoyl-L-alanine--D-glutamate ligase [Candidatus Kaiserbacteria bacterium]|nr:UDP-N-acetylmuramoyl-L-alanine--D-glutamate ligase [Candidatus Kaiserbacteria bacterium]